MKIVDCPALQHHVGVLPSLQILEWWDSSMRFLPDWMLSTHPVPIFPTLQRIIIIVGDVLTLRRCLKDGPEWPKIEHIPNVFIGVMYRPEFISYTKEPFSFFTNIDAVVDAPPPPGYGCLHSFKFRICVFVCVDNILINAVMLLLVLSFCFQGD
ncbi:hypothetical protein J5N97_015877 [Dioscorea zingiberensis]|uniref:Uncharacterized protein n=1 Tax=Dioscorea zingiberensis TaxID=325984 RepID=A0A9D5CIL6_9LILI|nr:hypothetical protein J5N97_015877 [Dioscorea zingiberensis]